LRSIHWLFVIGILLFVTGIAFVIVGARASRQAVTVELPITAPVASIKQIMNGIVAPHTDVIFNAVTTTVSASGVEEVAPETDEEWQGVGNSAAAIIESGNLLMMNGRAIDNDDWLKMTRAMMDAAQMAFNAAVKKSSADLFAMGPDLNDSCDACHKKYQRGS
jgi:hypothetical protein